MDIEKIKKAKTLSELELATKNLQEVSPEQRGEIALVLQEKAKQAIQDSKATRKQAEELLQLIETKKVSIVVEGKEYPLTEWVTISEYVKLFNLKTTSVVNNWIARGIVPNENILKITQLNNIQLIKAIPYLEK